MNRSTSSACNPAAWWGGVVGATVWMLAGVIEYGRGAPGLAALWLGCLAAALGVGVWLWSRRDRLRYPRAMVALLAASAVCGIVGMLATRSVLANAGRSADAAALNGPILGLPLLFGLLIAVFRAMDRRE